MIENLRRSGDFGLRGRSRVRNAEDADGVAGVVDLADVELAPLGQTLTDHFLDRSDRLIPRFVARDVVGVDALLNDENAHVHSLGALPLMHDFRDRCEQLLRMCPDIDVSASPLLSQGNMQQASCGHLEPSHEAARSLACCDGLVMLEPMADVPRNSSGTPRGFAWFRLSLGSKSRSLGVSCSSRRWSVRPSGGTGTAIVAVSSRPCASGLGSCAIESSCQTVAMLINIGKFRSCLNLNPSRADDTATLNTAPRASDWPRTRASPGS
jgi:hypothetical protein